MGKRELELAAARAGAELELVCKPFMLDPSLPAGGKDKLLHYTLKFGPQAEKMLRDPNNHLYTRGRSIGCDFKYVEGSKVFNSRKAHMLLTWAISVHGAAAQSKLKEVMLRMYLGEGANLGERPELLAAVKEAGLPEDEAASVLDGKHPKSDELEEEMEEELVDSHRKVSGVPAFYFPDGTHFTGGQPGQVFDRVIAQNLGKA